VNLLGCSPGKKEPKGAGGWEEAIHSVLAPRLTSISGGGGGSQIVCGQDSDRLTLQPCLDAQGLLEPEAASGEVSLHPVGDQHQVSSSSRLPLGRGRGKTLCVVQEGRKE
jgi:hypothetical protein